MVWTSRQHRSSTASDFTELMPAASWTQSMACAARRTAVTVARRCSASAALSNGRRARPLAHTRSVLSWSTAGRPGRAPPPHRLRSARAPVRRGGRRSRRRAPWRRRARRSGRSCCGPRPTAQAASPPPSCAHSGIARTGHAGLVGAGRSGSKVQSSGDDDIVERVVRAAGGPHAGDVPRVERPGADLSGRSRRGSRCRHRRRPAGRPS